MDIRFSFLNNCLKDIFVKINTDFYPDRDTIVQVHRHSNYNILIQASK